MSDDRGDVATAQRLRIERAAPDDASAIRSVEGLSGSTRRLLEHDLAGEDRRCLVARSDGEVVGFAAGLLQLDEGHVLDLAVRPSARRRGIGDRLLARLLVELRHLGATAVTLEVRPSNVAALALYERAGFVVEGRRPRYYPDGEDALLLWRRHLADRPDLATTDADADSGAPTTTDRS